MISIGSLKSSLLEDKKSFTQSLTKSEYYDTKEYVKMIFHVMSSERVTAGSTGSGGSHMGNAKSNLSAEAVASMVNSQMVLHPTDYVNTKGAGRGLVNLPKIPFALRGSDHDVSPRIEEARTNYVKNNPTYTKYFFEEDEEGELVERSSDTPVSWFVENYYTSFTVGAEGEKPFLPTGDDETKAYNAFVKFINTAKDNTKSEEINTSIPRWAEILSQPYINGEDRVLIAQAIDYFESKSGKTLAKLRGVDDSLGVKAIDGEVEGLSGLMGADSISSNDGDRLANNIPSKYRNLISHDNGEIEQFQAKPQVLNLLCIGSITADKTNDVTQIGMSKSEHARFYFFTMISPNQDGKFTEFPGKIGLIYMKHNIKFNYIPGNIYSKHLGVGDIKAISDKNTESNGVFVPKTIEDSNGEAYRAIQLPEMQLSYVDTLKGEVKSKNKADLSKKLNDTKPVAEPVKQNEPIVSKKFGKQLARKDVSTVSPEFEAKFMWLNKF